MFDATFEQATIIRTGPDGLTRVITRSSWDVDAYEAELVVLSGWEEFHEKALGFTPSWGVVGVLTKVVARAALMPKRSLRRRRCVLSRCAATFARSAADASASSRTCARKRSLSSASSRPFFEGSSDFIRRIGP